MQAAADQVIAKPAGTLLFSKCRKWSSQDTEFALNLIRIHTLQYEEHATREAAGAAPDAKTKPVALRKQIRCPAIPLQNRSGT